MRLREELLIPAWLRIIQPSLFMISVHLTHDLTAFAWKRTGRTASAASRFFFSVCRDQGHSRLQCLYHQFLRTGVTEVPATWVTHLAQFRQLLQY
jgi:hypothetical protein